MISLNFSASLNSSSSNSSSCLISFILDFATSSASCLMASSSSSSFCFFTILRMYIGKLMNSEYLFISSSMTFMSRKNFSFINSFTLVPLGFVVGNFVTEKESSPLDNQTFVSLSW